MVILFLIRAVLVNPGPERRHSGLEAIGSAIICQKTKEFDLSDLIHSKKRQKANVIFK
jgi:hypothetical protein